MAPGELLDFEFLKRCGGEAYELLEHVCEFEKSGLHGVALGIELGDWADAHGLEEAEVREDGLRSSVVIGGRVVGCHGVLSVFGSHGDVKLRCYRMSRISFVRS